MFAAVNVNNKSNINASAAADSLLMAKNNYEKPNAQYC